jgi:predicted chitinase
MAMDNITSNNNANFYWWFGVVEDRNDPLRLGRCRVRIIGYHSEDNEVLPTEDLPWAMPVMPANSAGTSGVGWSPTGAVEGSWVVGFFADGENGQHPMFFGTVGAIPGGLRASDCQPEDGVGSQSDNATTSGEDGGSPSGNFVEPTGDGKDVATWFEAFLDANGPKNFKNWGPTAKAAIMAQCHKETGGFKQFTELGGETYWTNLYDIRGSRPTAARNNGNTTSGDGIKYRGRGFIQLTWKNNYRRAGESLGVELLSRPELAATKEIAAKTALWHFYSERKNIDKKNQWGDNTAVTKAVNGNGAKQETINQRKVLFDGYKKKYGVA